MENNMIGAWPLEGILIYCGGAIILLFILTMLWIKRKGKKIIPWIMIAISCILMGMSLLSSWVIVGYHAPNIHPIEPGEWLYGELAFTLPSIIFTTAFLYLVGKRRLLALMILAAMVYVLLLGIIWLVKG